MKKILTTALSLLFAYFISAQNILVADNNPGAPTGTHVYTSLQAAVDAATSGDIIHVIPSATQYDNGSTVVHITTSGISIYGVGFKPDKDGPQLATIYDLRISASDVRVSGFNVTHGIYIGYNNGSYSGITIENSDFGYIDTSTSTNITVSNVLVRACIVNRENNDSGPGILFTPRVNNSVVSNCIIEGYNTTSATYEALEAYNGTIIKNCIFFGNDNAAEVAFEDLQNCTISNCIFFGRPPVSNGSIFENNVFNNCVSVGSNDNSFPPTQGATGSGNTESGSFTAITDATTIFADANIVFGSNWSLNWDPAVVHASLLSGGTDGTDVGVEGSTIPYSVTGTPLPLIQKLIVPEVIKQGDDLNATIQAQGN